MNHDQQVLYDLIPSLPKVLLHDHLDGGLRPQTIIDLAADIGHQLPTRDPNELAAWFSAGSDDGRSPGHGAPPSRHPARNAVEAQDRAGGREAAVPKACGAASDGDAVGIFGTLEQYLETFAHTTAVMQTADALARVAREAVLDLAADGVVYTEQRWAPEQHLVGGLSLDEAVAAVQLGLQEGMAEAATQGKKIYAYQLLCAMRQNDRWEEIADLAIRWVDKARGLDTPACGGHSTDGMAARGLDTPACGGHSTDGMAPGAVVGFDLAGPEAGFPPSGPQSDIWLRLVEAGVPVTIHAGEGDGVESIASAVQVGRALRLGHGVRIIDDVAASGGAAEPELGPIATWVRDRRIPLEVAVRSNIQTRAAGATTVANHPITQLSADGFAVTINTDNRLMSRTSMSTEMRGLVEQAGWTLLDLYVATVTAAKHAFIHYPQRQQLIRELINPAYVAAHESITEGTAK